MKNLCLASISNHRYLRDTNHSKKNFNGHTSIGHFLKRPKLKENQLKIKSKLKFFSVYILLTNCSMNN